MPKVSELMGKIGQESLGLKTLGVDSLELSLGKKAELEAARSIARNAIGDMSAVVAKLNTSAVYDAFSSMSVAKDLLRATQEMENLKAALAPRPRFDEMLPGLNNWIAAQDFARSIPYHSIESQLLVGSQLKSFIHSYKAAIGSSLKNLDALTNDIARFKDSLLIAGIPRELFRESYLKAIEAISGNFFAPRDLMYESVQRIIEGQNSYLMKTAQLAEQALVKNILPNASAALSQSFVFPVELMQRAVDPFMREWASLVYESRVVSVDISHDENHLLYAEYDSETVVELLAARLALEESQPEASISSSGSLEQPDTLSDGSGNHDDYHAQYYGETHLTSPDNSTKKKLSQYVDELRQNGTFTEEEWEQIESEARRAEIFVRENFADVMHIAFLFLMEISLPYIKEGPISAEQFRARQDKALARFRERLPKREEGRPTGTGLFKDEYDFKKALKEVLEKFSKRPSQVQVLRAIRQHSLCQKPPKDPSEIKEAKTLRNWLDRCGMTYEEALKRYWKPAQSGK